MAQRSFIIHRFHNRPRSDVDYCIRLIIALPCLLEGPNDTKISPLFISSKPPRQKVQRRDDVVLSTTSTEQAIELAYQGSRLGKMPVVKVEDLVRLQRKADDIRNVRTSFRKLQSMLFFFFSTALND